MEPMTMMAIAGGVQAAGGMLSSYMQGKGQEEMHDEEMRQRKKEFKHGRFMDIASNSRADQTTQTQDNIAESGFNRQLRDDAADQQFFLTALRSLNTGS